MPIGDKIDKLYELRAIRLDLSREVDEMKAKEVAMKQDIMDELDAVGLAKATGQKATAGRTCKIQPTVLDWDQVFDYIKNNDAFDLVQRRISNLAWKERLDSGILIPGTESIDVWDLSLTKSTR